MPQHDGWAASRRCCEERTSLLEHPAVPLRIAQVVCGDNQPRLASFLILSDTAHLGVTGPSETVSKGEGSSV